MSSISLSLTQREQYWRQKGKNDAKSDQKKRKRDQTGTIKKKRRKKLKKDYC